MPKPLRYERYGRYFAVYEGETLVCVTVYKKGAREVLKRLTESTPPVLPAPPLAPSVPTSR